MAGFTSLFKKKKPKDSEAELDKLEKEKRKQISRSIKADRKTSSATGEGVLESNRAARTAAKRAIEIGKQKGAMRKRLKILDKKK
jgi:hypothetical protein